MLHRTTQAIRRRSGLTTSVLGLATAALGGLFLLAAGPAPILLGESAPGETTAELASERATQTLRPGDEVLVAQALHGLTIEIAPPLVYETDEGEAIDPERIHVWLEDRNSPMASYAEELVAAGIEHDVDPRLVVGIAAIESSAGKRLPPGSHNAWGWNGSGPHGLQAWPSWPVAIDEFTEGLARVYDTDNVDERMARKYVPPNWQKWLRTVRWVMEDI